MLFYNELIFIVHVFTAIGLTFGALRLGKEWLISFIAVQAIFANLFVFKQMQLFGLFVTCGDVYIVSAIFGLNLLQEFFGKEPVKRAIYLGVALSLSFIVLTYLHLLYTPSSFDTMQGHYQAILGHTPRVIIASHLVSFCIQQLDCFLYGVLYSWCNGKYIVARNFISVSITQACDTILFSIVGLYGLVYSIGDIMLMSFTIKIIVIAMLSPMMFLIKKYMKV